MEKSYGELKYELNSYFGMAENDYLFAKNGFDTCAQIGSYNSVASIAAQSAEKYLKAIINENFIDDENNIRLLKSHNLRALFNKIIEKYDKWETDVIEIKWLGDFYFDARYPGDDFVYVNENDAIRCLEILESIRKTTAQILAEKRKSDTSLESLDSFIE